MTASEAMIQFTRELNGWLADLGLEAASADEAARCFDFGATSKDAASLIAEERLSAKKHAERETLPPAGEAERFQVFALVDARVLRAFAPIIRSPRERPYDDPTRFLWEGTFFVYPHEDGALCIATDGITLAAYLDRKGRASAPARFVIPDDLLAACRPPAPIMGFYEGEWEPLALPPWAQPGMAYLTASGAFISPQMHHPVDDPKHAHVLFSRIVAFSREHRDDDYRASPPSFDIRQAIAPFLATPVASGAISLYPKRLADFCACAEALGLDGWATIQEHVGKGVSIRFQGAPDFIGFIGPLESVEPLPFPAFATPPGPETTRTSEGAAA